MSQHDAQGWWWPASLDLDVPQLGEAAEPPDESLPGKMVVGDEGRAELTTFGALVNPFDEPGRGPAAMWGVNLRGTPVSILEPQMRSRTGTLGAAGEEVWTAFLVLVGAHVVTEAQLRATRWTAAVFGLREWMTEPWGADAEAYPLWRGRSAEKPPSSRRRSLWPPHRSEARRAGAAYARGLSRRRSAAGREQPQSFSAQSGVLDFGILRKESNSKFESRTTRDAQVDLNLGRPATLREVEDEWLTPVSDMLAVMGGTPSVVTRLEAHVPFELPPMMRPVVNEASEPSLMSSREVHVLRFRRKPTGSPNLNGGMPMPARAARPGTRGRLVDRWFQLHRELGRSGTFLFGTLHGRDQWLENQLLNLVSFAEAYHQLFYDQPLFDERLNKALMRQALKALPAEMKEPWRQKLNWAPRMTQAQRLQDLVDRNGWLVPEGHRTKLVSRLTQTRNYLTHWGKRGTNVVEDGALAQTVEQFLTVLFLDLLERMRVDLACAEHAALRRDVFRRALVDVTWG